MFTGPLKVLQSDMRPCKADYAVLFVELHIMDLVKNIIFLNFLATNSRELYISCMRLSKMKINHRERLSLPMNLS